MKCLIAINFHAFHDMERLDACLCSLIKSIDLVDEKHKHTLNTVLFNNSNKDLSAFLKYKKQFPSFEILQLDVDVSGLGLNQQIEHAISNHYDIFFRVDSDDEVYENRFHKQIALLDERADVDICGGGLDYFNLASSQSYQVVPNEAPADFDYLMNRYCLHPTFALRVSSLSDKLRYWEKRIEDKKIILDAKTLGLSFYNIQETVGKYYLDNKTRGTVKFAWLSLKLDLSWCYKFKPIYSVIAIMSFLIRCFVGVSFLRKLRSWIFKEV